MRDLFSRVVGVVRPKKTLKADDLKTASDIASVTIRFSRAILWERV
jgi:hypothetical protein